MKRVLVIGSGKRVREAALPSLIALEEDFEVTRIAARTAKQMRVGERTFEVVALDGFGPSWLEGIDLVYLAVTKDAVPSVLDRLVAAGVEQTDLLIDTPVVRFKHYRKVALLDRFRNAWVAEDCTALPWMDLVHERLGEGLIGDLRRVVFHRSAYAYHGVATAKTLLASTRVTRARRAKGPGDLATRTLTFANGRRAVMVEPRDYSVGHLTIEGATGRISDGDPEAEHALAPVVEDGRWVGFRVGDRERRLSAREVELLGPGDPDARVTARMDDLKRVGFLRLLEGIRDGRGAYPVEEAVDDMVVDYHLEKAGLFLANPFTSPRSALGRGLLRALTRLGGA